MPKFYRRFIRVRGKIVSSPRFEKKRDADKWAEEMRRKKQFLRDGITIDDDGDSFKFIDYAREWLQKRIKSYPKATWGQDEQRLRDYVLPKLSEIPISSITHQMIREVLNGVTESGKSVETRKRVQSLLSVIFTDAFNENPPLVQLNPVAGIRFKDRRIGKKKPSYIADADLCLKFLQSGRDLSELHFVIAAIGIMAGLRKSEMLALRWKNFDPLARSLIVSEKIEQATMSVKRGTKGGEEITRVVPIPLELSDVLTAYRKASKWSGSDDFILAREHDGRFLGPRELSRLHEEIREKSGINVTVHGMRHSYGREFALRSGNIKALQAILGHSSSSTTDLYSELSGRRLESFGDVVSFDVSQKGVKQSIE